MKFLVFGCTGMAGHVISIYLKENGHDVTGFGRRKVDYVNCIVGDVKNLETIKNVVNSGQYDVIVNAIGILNQNAEDNKADAVFLNSFFPHYLAEITKDMPTQIIHMSTDCVFSGKTGGYTENSFRDGESFYDRTKAVGEIEDNKNLTLRNSIVGPDINENGIGLLNWFMKQSNTVKGYTGAMWTGMTTLQLAKVIEQAALKNVAGLYNMVPDHNISKFELLKLFNHYLKNDTIIIEPYSDFVLDKTLIRTRNKFLEPVPNYSIMIKELSEWMKLHKNLYPHYNLLEDL